MVSAAKPPLPSHRLAELIDLAGGSPAGPVELASALRSLAALRQGAPVEGGPSGRLRQTLAPPWRREPIALRELLGRALIELNGAPEGLMAEAVDLAERNLSPLGAGGARVTAHLRARLELARGRAAGLWGPEVEALLAWALAPNRPHLGSAAAPEALAEALPARPRPEALAEALATARARAPAVHALLGPLAEPLDLLLRALP